MSWFTKNKTYTNTVPHGSKDGEQASPLEWKRMSEHESSVMEAAEMALKNFDSNLQVSDMKLT